MTISSMTPSDISEAETEIHSNLLQRFQSIVHSSPVALHFYRLENNGQLVLTETNPAADAMLGVAHKPLHRILCRRLR